MNDRPQTTEAMAPPAPVLDLFKRGRFMDGARLWAEQSESPLPAVSMWCLSWLDRNAKVRRPRAPGAEKYCNDNPARRVSDCLHCGDECRE